MARQVPKHSPLPEEHHTVVWLLRNLDTDDVDDDRRDFLNRLLASSNVELLRCDFEGLQDELGKRMVVSAPPIKQLRGQRDGSIIHIWHSMENATALQPLKQYLNDNNCGGLGASVPVSRICTGVPN